MVTPGAGRSFLVYYHAENFRQTQGAYRASCENHAPFCAQPMIEALEREVSREERLQAFVREAGAADVAIDAGEHVFRAEDVHVWLERLAAKRKSARPKPWRK